MLRHLKPLKQTDYRAVKHLFHEAFDLSEDKYLNSAWKKRNEAASLGYWDRGCLIGAAIVRDLTLEYICVGAAARGSGIGTQLLQAVIQKTPALHLTPVNDPRVIRWYESQGFVLSVVDGDRKVYTRHQYNLRPRSTCSSVVATPSPSSPASPAFSAISTKSKRSEVLRLEI